MKVKVISEGVVNLRGKGHERGWSDRHRDTHALSINLREQGSEGEREIHMPYQAKGMREG